VGREAELQALTRAVARVRSGIGGVVTVVGEAGIGKSRLVAEAGDQESRVTSHGSAVGDFGSEARDGSVRWVEGRWLSYTEGMAYYGWQELLRRLLRLPDECTRTACVALEERVEALCPHGAAAIYPYVARLLNLPLDEATAAQLDSLVDAGLLQSAIFRAVADLVTCVAEQEPLALVLEDVHWADEASLALLEHLLALTDRVPLLIFVTLRPIRDHGCWRIREAMLRDYSHRLTDVWLRPLSPEESGTLVRRLLAAGGGEGEASADLTQEVQERAEGNPFFAAEIVRAFLDREPLDEGLPATVQGVLMARIDRLSPSARHVLQLAAVVGRVFRYRVLADILTGSVEGALDATLLRLVRAQMIRES
ncbi:MAG: AAA family ATPase, partial [Anaerolineae bacterium]